MTNQQKTKLAVGLAVGAVILVGIHKTRKTWKAFKEFWNEYTEFLTKLGRSVREQYEFDQIIENENWD